MSGQEYSTRELPGGRTESQRPAHSATSRGPEPLREQGGPLLLWVGTESDTFRCLSDSLSKQFGVLRAPDPQALSVLPWSLRSRS